MSGPSPARKYVTSGATPSRWGWGLGLPLLLVAFFGWVMNLDVRQVRVAVSDRDNTRASRALAEAFSASGFFTVERAPAGCALTRLTDSGRAQAVVVIEAGFARNLGRREGGRVQVLLDGADNSTAGMVLGYLAGMERSANAHIAGTPTVSPVALETKFPVQPGAQQPLVHRARLNGRGHGHALGPFDRAYGGARMGDRFDGAFAVHAGQGRRDSPGESCSPIWGWPWRRRGWSIVWRRCALGVPFMGSHAFFLLACFLFLAPSLAQGLLISVLVRQQALATQIGLVTGLLPPLLLSGFVFPIESMPAFFRYFTAILAPRWFVEVCRGIYLKGAGPVELAVPLLAMLAIGLVLVAAAVKKFKADLEL